MNPISARFAKPQLAAAIMVAAATLSVWNATAAFAAMPLEDVIDRAVPSVARVVRSGTFINKEGKLERTSAVGTAFVIDNGGHLLTNCHVASDYKHDLITRTVQVVFGDDQSRYDAEVVGCDEPSDLGLLYVPEVTGKRKPLAFAQAIKTGQEVIAVGFAQNIDGLPTITRGIVSGINRTDFYGDFADLVQTDAVLNHGNSGGPLMNMNGEVVGVNTYIYKAPAQGVNGETTTVQMPGMYLARSAVTASLFARKPIDKGEIVRPDLGLNVVSVDRWSIDELRLPNGGVEVKVVEQGSIAARAGIEAGHIIHAITVNGVRHPIHDRGSFYNLLAQIEGGDTARLHFMAFTAQGEEAKKNGEPLSSSMIKWLYVDVAIPSSTTTAPTQANGAQTTQPATQRPAT
jgi:S1-C subfamily serine protease